MLSSSKSLWRTVRSGRRVSPREVRWGSVRLIRKRPGGSVARRAGGERDEARDPRVRGAHHERPQCTTRNDPTNLHSKLPRIPPNESSRPFCTTISNAFPRLNNRLRNLDLSPANPPFKTATDLPVPLSGTGPRCGRARRTLFAPGLTGEEICITIFPCGDPPLGEAARHQ